MILNGAVADDKAHLRGSAASGTAHCWQLLTALYDMRAAVTRPVDWLVLFFKYGVTKDSGHAGMKGFSHLSTG